MLPTSFATPIATATNNVRSSNMPEYSAEGMEPFSNTRTIVAVIVAILIFVSIITAFLCLGLRGNATRRQPSQRLAITTTTTITSTRRGQNVVESRIYPQVPLIPPSHIRSSSWPASAQSTQSQATLVNIIPGSRERQRRIELAFPRKFFLNFRRFFSRDVTRLPSHFPAGSETSPTAPYPLQTLSSRIPSAPNPVDSVSGPLPSGSDTAPNLDTPVHSSDIADNYISILPRYSTETFRTLENMESLSTGFGIRSKSQERESESRVYPPSPLPIYSL